LILETNLQNFKRFKTCLFCSELKLTLSAPDHNHSFSSFSIQPEPFVLIPAQHVLSPNTPCLFLLGLDLSNLAFIPLHQSVVSQFHLI